MRSSLEIYDLAAGQSRVLWQTDDLIEAPNWHPDGWLLVNRDGRLLRVQLDSGAVTVIDTGDVVVHVFRPEVRDFYQLEKMWQSPSGGASDRR